MKIFLDDERFPLEGDWVLARNADAFRALVLEHADEIEEISFDHDLGDESETGYECVKWLVDFALDNPDRLWMFKTATLHSANIVGIENMSKYFLNVQRVGALGWLNIYAKSVLYHPDYASVPKEEEEEE